MEVHLSEQELIKGLKEIRRAKRNGFMYCKALFRIVTMDMALGVGEYEELLERAHETNGNLNWGRGQDITKRFKFKDGKLEKL